MVKKAVDCNGLSFDDCQLAIVRSAVSKIEKTIGYRTTQLPSLQHIIKIVEQFIQSSKVVCYGGTAINNLLPKSKQFYNKNTDIPDYDFYSGDALKDAKRLADIYVKNGYTEVEAKSGQHHGTYKVFVNFIAIADITQLPDLLFSSIYETSIVVNKIHYAHPNFLRMSMYLELSRPEGDVSRWEKVLSRLNALNSEYPPEKIHCNKSFSRSMHNSSNNKLIYNITKQVFINAKCIFFGGFALNIYANKKEGTPDFDVIIENPSDVIATLQELLSKKHIEISVEKHDAIGEIIPQHYELKYGEDTFATLYEPIACHNYNIIKIRNRDVSIATIDTMLSFYLAFLYIDKPYYRQFVGRIECAVKLLTSLHRSKQLAQKGVWRRFSMTCHGKQKTLADIKQEKSQKYEELKSSKSSKEYEEWFLSYRGTGAPKKPTKTMKTMKTIKNPKKNMARTKIKKMGKHRPTKKKTIKKKMILA